MTDNQERQLVARAQAGEQQALGELISRHQEAVFAMTLRILQNRDEAMDATQEALLRVVRHIRGFRPDRPLRPWVRKIAVRSALNQAGRSARTPTGASDPDLLPASGEDPHQAAGRAQTQRSILAALKALSPAQRAAFVCKELEGLDTAETARAMGCRQATVRWHLFEAKKRLATALATERRGQS